MADLGELARELREALQQQQAVTERLLRLCAALEKESIEKGQSGVLVPYDAIVTEWNERCAARGMKRRNTAGELKPALLRIWRRWPSMDTWKAAFDACARNEWWTGSGGWRGNLESFVRPAHYGKFFDEAVAAAPVSAPSADRGLAFPEHGEEGDLVEEEISALLDDKKRPLPITGLLDPREVRGRDDAEFQRRLEVLTEAMRSDFRFARS